jgi:aryl-alcohol dehydrogenase-like predicted oxidoreductase
VVRFGQVASVRSVSDPQGVALARHPKLSRLGLGTWAFGRTGWGVQDDRDSREAMLKAVELGITWIDTAAVYGDGHAERLVGRTLRELTEAERPLIFTKGGVCVDRASGETFRDLRPASLRRQCEDSLRQLGVERVDLYQLHWPVDDPHLVEDAWEALGSLQQEGKIRWAGVSNFDLGQLTRCAAHRPVESVQSPLSLLSRDAAATVLPWAAEHGACVLVYSPLESGLLSGGFSRQRLSSLPPEDWRAQRMRFRQSRVDRTFEMVQRIAAIGARVGASTAETAIAWTLAWPGVSGAIVGARGAEQVEGLIGSSRLTLDDSALEEIATALLDTGVGSGPIQVPTSHAGGPR